MIWMQAFLTVMFTVGAAANITAKQWFMAVACAFIAAVFLTSTIRDGIQEGRREKKP